jgi:hypothetical protein
VKAEEKGTWLGDVAPTGRAFGGKAIDTWTTSSVLTDIFDARAREIHSNT